MSNLSNFFKILNSHSSYTRDPILVKKGSGIYKGSDWGLTRADRFVFYSNSTLQNYFRMIFQDADKISSASLLCEKFDFSAFNKVGDIGGVPFSQSWAIKTIFPHLKFVLSDHDLDSLVKHKACPPFMSEHCDFASFDALVDDLTIFDDCDIFTMWGVDYALKDIELLRLLKLVKNQEKSLLLATIDIDSKSLFKRFSSELFGSFLKAFGLSRYHGLLRNQSYITELCRSADVNCKYIMADNSYRIFQIN